MLQVGYKEPEIQQDPVSGRRTVTAPRGLAPDEQRMCELAELGFAPETIAARCRCSQLTVRRILESTGGEIYRDYLAMQREVDMEFLNTTWQDLELMATERLAGLLTNPDSSPTVQLNAIKEVLDRHPERRLVKTSREERVVSGGITFDVKGERSRMLEVHGDVLGVSPVALESQR